MTPISPLRADATRAIERHEDAFRSFDGASILITGGTGFVGSWLLEVFTCFVDRLDLDARVTVLSRDPAKFVSTRPHLANHPRIGFHRGDLVKRDFAFPHASFTHVIHAAMPVDGTHDVVAFARRSGARRFLYVSSGAAGFRYTEYGREKARGEDICRRHFGNTQIARCWAFVGPYLPLDSHYAVATFVGQALAGGPIRCVDGRAMRSYMYGADLGAWLWVILARGVLGATVDVGSRIPISVALLADEVGRALRVPVLHDFDTARSTPHPHYWPRIAPSPQLAPLKLSLTFGLRESIEKMARFYGWEG